MKRILSLILVLVLVLGSMPLAFADEHEMTDGEKLAELGLVQGDEEGNLMEDSALTRAEMMVMLARLNGVEDEVMDYDLPSTFTDVEDHWAAKYIAYAQVQGWTQGVGDNMFAPQDEVNAQQVATFMLRVLGYEDNWETALVDAAALGIMDDEPGENFVRKKAFDMMNDAVNTEVAEGGMTLGQKLGVVEMEEEVVVEEVAIESAVALNSTVVEVALDEDVDAPEMVDASIFMVMDEDDADVAVESAEFAGWDADNYTVLVTLAEGTEAGTLYTITSGDTSENFGGRAADEDEPTVSSVTSTDYNEVTVEFNEAINPEGLSLEITEKYGDKDDLAVLDWAWDGSTKIAFTTDAQADATLYSTTIAGAMDLAGNEMDEDDTNTFVGQEMPDDELKLSSAKANDYNEVAVKFNVKVDPETVDASKFTITEKYGDKEEIVVLNAEVAADDEEYYGTTQIKDLAATADQDSDLYVILSVEDLADATLYEIEIDDMMTLYGENLDSDSNTTTFVGVEKPSDDFAYTVSSSSNTEVSVVFGNKVDEASATDVAMYEIAEKYGDKDDLVVLEAVLEDDEKTVTLTTSEQNDGLYEITVSTDIMDIYGNNVDSDSDVMTFVGEEVQDEIAAITDIERISDTVIRVEFDQKVGSNADDVANYFIDGGVGYPEKAVKTASSVSGYLNKVDLTIPETTDAKVYTLTVSNLLNSDGIAMEEDEIDATFTGAGEAAGLPEIEAAIATDDQTLKIYFDRDVTGNEIDTVLWDSANNDFTVPAASEMTMQASNGSASGLDTFLSGTANYYVYQSDDDDNVLVVVTKTPKFEEGTGYDTFILKANASYVNDDYNEVTIAANNDDAVGPALEAAQGLDKKTVMLYFTKPAVVTTTDIELWKDGSKVTTSLSLVDVAGTDTEFKLVSSTDLTSDEYEVRIKQTAVTNSTITDITGQLDYNDYDDTDSVYAEKLAFAASGDAIEKIDGINAVMTDSRTMDVYFPEDMLVNGDNTDSVVEEDNYTISNTGGTTQTTTKPVFVEYDDETYVATLYFNASLDEAADKYYLTVASTMENAVQTTTVDGVDNANKLEFALDDDAVSDADFTSSELSKDHKTLTVKFDKAVAFGDASGLDGADFKATGVANDEFGNEDALVATDFTDGDLEAYVVATGTFANGNAITATEYAITRIDNDEIKIVFDEELKAGSEVVVKSDMANSTATQNIFDMTGDKVNSDKVAADEISIKVGVPSTINSVNAFAPSVVSSQSLDADNDGTVEAIEVYFDTAVSVAAKGNFAANNGADVTISSITVNGGKVTFNLDEGDSDNDTSAYTITATNAADIASAYSATATLDWTSGTPGAITDKAAPVLMSAVFGDNLTDDSKFEYDNTNTVSENIVLTFSEDVDSVTGETAALTSLADFTVANVEANEIDNGILFVAAETSAGVVTLSTSAAGDVIATDALDGNETIAVTANIVDTATAPNAAVTTPVTITE